MMTVRIDELSVTLGDATLLDALCLQIDGREVVGIVGPNGSGKSTALRCLYRALRPTTGTVWVQDTDVTTLAPRDAARRIAAVTQEAGAEFDFTVAEMIALGRIPHHRGHQPLTEAERDLCRAAMARMDVTHLAERGMLSLSGGERQRTLIARALVQQPEVLVLDEPTNHLDIAHQLRLLTHLRTLGVTVVVVLHDLNLAAATCDRLALIADGRLVASGTPEAVLTAERVHAVFGVEPTVVRHPLTGVPQLLLTPHEPLTPSKGHPW